MRNQLAKNIGKGDVKGKLGLVAGHSKNQVIAR